MVEQRQDPSPAVPSGMAPAIYQACLAGPLILGLGVGLQLMLAGLILWGPMTDPTLADRMTAWGRSATFPERDLALYVAGIVVCVALVVTSVRLWQRRVEQVDLSRRTRFAVFSAIFQAFMGIASLVVFLLSIDLRFPIVPAENARNLDCPWIMLFLPALLAAGCCGLDLWRGWKSDEPKPAPIAASPWPGRIGMAVAALGIVGLLYIPAEGWSRLAGLCLFRDSMPGPFGQSGPHHWNFFAMGPSLSYLHGGAFGTDFYSQYGIGWPMTFAALNGVLPLSYAHMLGIVIIYGCLYYVALLAFVRGLFGRTIWAVIGVTLAVFWQMFDGTVPDVVQWTYPSSTMLRHSMDIWFFLALLLHARSGRKVWVVLAGVAAAAAVIFETDTGAYLAPTFLCYWLGRAGLAADQGRPAGRRDYVWTLALFAAAGAVTLGSVLYVASRGTMFQAAFWSGWTECLRTYAGLGVSLIPVASVDAASLALFVVMAGAYIAAAGMGLLDALSRRLGRRGLLLACVGVYGLATLIAFVGRSHPLNLYHPTVPFAVVLTGVLFYLNRIVARDVPRTVAPCAVAVLLVALLLTKPSVQSYPGLIRTALSPLPPPTDVALVDSPRDLSDLPESAKPAVRAIQQMAQTFSSLPGAEGQLAILDGEDTLYYYLCKIKPWGRYPTLFPALLTREQVEQVRRDLLSRPPAYVVIRSSTAPRPSGFDDVWSVCYQILPGRYTRTQTVGPYEIWRHND